MKLWTKTTQLKTFIQICTSNFYMIVLGIDPGLATLGFGVIECRKDAKTKKYTCKKKPADFSYDYIYHNKITTKSGEPCGERLKKINNELSRLIKKYQPEVMAVEKLFFFKNLKTVMPVSQAVGVILLTAAKNNLPVYEFTPLQVKMTITGYGRAEKEDVQKKIKSMLRLKEIPKPDDAADALAIALTYFLKEVRKQA